jgi:hypothetical protein
MHPTQDVVAATQDFDLIAMDVTSYEEFLNHECKTIDRRRREVDRQLELLILRGKQLERELYEREREIEILIQIGRINSMSMVQRV